MTLFNMFTIVDFPLKITADGDNVLVCYNKKCALQIALGIFLSRVSTLTRDIDIAILSVCLSVRLSVTRWYCMKTA